VLSGLTATPIGFVMPTIVAVTAPVAVSMTDTAFPVLLAT
jgi:hypothetical protein